MTIENIIIEHANKLAKGLYMYDQDNPIDNLIDALTMITFDSLENDEVDSSEIYDCINGKFGEKRKLKKNSYENYNRK